MKDDKIPKTIKGVERTNFCQMIVKSTATNFAMMINMKNRGANFKFTPEHVTNLTWTGFFAGGYDKNDLIKLYDGIHCSNICPNLKDGLCNVFSKAINEEHSVETPKIRLKACVDAQELARGIITTLWVDD